jgi:hypothetical protein
MLALDSDPCVSKFIPDEFKPIFDHKIELLLFLDRDDKSFGTCAACGGIDAYDDDDPILDDEYISHQVEFPNNTLYNKYGRIVKTPIPIDELKYLLRNDDIANLFCKKSLNYTIHSAWTAVEYDVDENKINKNWLDIIYILI